MIYSWFKTLSLKDKIVTITVTLLVLAYLATSLRLRFLQYKYSKSIKDNIEYYQKQLQASEADTKQTINDGKKSIKKAIDKNKAIDKKLQDEKNTIDNSDYPVSKLDSLLSSYGN